MMLLASTATEVFVGLLAIGGPIGLVVFMIVRSCPTAAERRVSNLAEAAIKAAGGMAAFDLSAQDLHHYARYCALGGELPAKRAQHILLHVQRCRTCADFGDTVSRWYRSDT